MESIYHQVASIAAHDTPRNLHIWTEHYINGDGSNIAIRMATAMTLFDNDNGTEYSPLPRSR